MKLLFYISVAIIIWAILRRPRPAASHNDYMQGEYKNVMAYAIAEMKIDSFLLTLENKPN